MSTPQEVSRAVLGEPAEVRPAPTAARRRAVALGLTVLALAGVAAAPAVGALELRSVADQTAGTTCCIPTERI